MKGSFRCFGSLPRLVLAGLLAFSASFLSAERVEDLPKPTDYVSDFAHVLSPEAVARLDRLCTQLDHSQANAQVAVVTVHTLEGEEAADYASQLEDKWKMGKKGTDRGVLILLAVDDHKRRIDVGYGLEGILPDAKVGDVGREMVPYLRRNDFDDAVLMAVSDVGQVIATDAKVSLQDSEEGQPSPQMGRRVVRHSSPLGGVILLIILLVFFGGFWLVRLLFGFGLLSALFGGGRGPWMGGGWGGGSWGSGGGWGGGGGGGGDGGGSGFGGFGGGDFGGGGAGGDW